MELGGWGAEVGINYHSNGQGGNAVADEVRRMGRRAEIFAADVGVELEAQRLAANALQDFGSIEILVNNAGFGTSVVGRPPVVEMTLDNADLLIRTHVYGPLVLCRAIVPQMRKSARGDVIMISSIAAQMFGANMGTYNIAKAGMEALAFALAKEERAHGIRVNVVAPGLFETTMGWGMVKPLRGSADLRSMPHTCPSGLYF